MRKWIFALTVYCFQYVPQKEVKGQVLTDFLTNHPSVLIEKDIFEVDCIGITPWKLMFDSSKNEKGVGVGIVLVSS